MKIHNSSVFHSSSVLHYLSVFRLSSLVHLVRRHVQCAAMILGVGLGGMAAVSVAQGAEERLISTAVGRVGDDVLTSREVVLFALTENILSRRKKPVILNPEAVKTKEFARETTAALIEIAVSLEGEAFGAGDVPEAEVKKALEEVTRNLKKSPNGRSLEFDGREIDRVVRRKLRAKDFIRFKIQSATIPVSDQEARTYFDQNRLKFENLPFEGFRENIKAYLSKQQVDRRLRDWLELLQSKYRVRSLLAE